MWTARNRGRYDRSALRYPSDLTDDEWARVEPVIPPARHGGNKRRVDVREVFSPEVRWTGSYVKRFGSSAQALQIAS